MKSQNVGTGIPLFNTGGICERWRAFFANKGVPADMVEKHLNVIREKNLVLGELTEAQQSLPSNEYIGRGIEAVMALPGIDSAICAKAVEIVRKCFPDHPNVAPNDQAVTTWNGAVQRYAEGQNYFIESDPGFEGKVGVVDAIFLYFLKENSAIHLDLSAPNELMLVGVHGLYHYLLHPDVFYCLRFAVDPKFQGQGFGHMIMAHSMRQLLRLGGSELQLFTAPGEGNAAIVNMYLHWGFQPTGRTIKYNGVPQIFLGTKVVPGTRAWEMANSLDDNAGRA